MLAGACALALCVSVAADVRAARVSGDQLVTYEQYSLPNGLQVILSRDPRLPIVTVNLWYHVGALDERPGHSGFAHLFEHMMFEGSAHVPAGKHLSMLEHAGATDLNATTDFDHTAYFETVPANYLQTALWLESDRMGFLLDALTPEKFNIQRAVVENERRQRVDTTPYGLAREKAWGALFPAPHPYHGDVIGSMADLNAAGIEDVREFFATYYVPSNATLTIVGDFDPLLVRKEIAQYFGPLPERPRPATPELPPVRFEHRVVVEQALRPGNLPMLWRGWHSPVALSQDDAVADVLAEILAHGKASRLVQQLVYKQQLAQSVSAQQMSMAAQSAFVIIAIARPHVPLVMLERALQQALQDVREHGVTQGQVDRARTTLQTELVESLQKQSGLAQRLQYYNQYTGDPGYLPKDLARYDAVTPSAVQELARRVLSADAGVSLRAEPQPMP